MLSTSSEWKVVGKGAFIEGFLLAAGVGISLVNLHNYGKSPFLMGKSTINGHFFNSYVCLPEGKPLPKQVAGQLECSAAPLAL
jgi:hypothetical protein